MADWSFRGTTFVRMDPDGQARAWPERLERTVDIVAGDVSATPRRHVDIGAITHEPWSFRAGCTTQVARDALVGYRYTQGTLTTVGGATYTALCVKATPLTHDGGPLYYADLEFEFVS